MKKPAKKAREEADEACRQESRGRQEGRREKSHQGAENQEGCAAESCRESREGRPAAAAARAPGCWSACAPVTRKSAG